MQAVLLAPGSAGDNVGDKTAWRVECWKGPEHMVARYYFSGEGAENFARQFYTGYMSALADTFRYREV